MVERAGQGLDVEIGVTLERLTKQLAQAEARMIKAAKKSEDSFKRSNAKAAQSFSQIDRAAAKTESRLAGLGASLSEGAAGFARGGLAGIVAGLGSAATIGAVVQLSNSVATLRDEARRAGVEVEAFQRLKFVAEQNRVGVDSLVDGLKELNLRADEFILTGAGPASEAFRRLGFSADELAQALKDPEELLFDIIGRLENFDQAGQIRIADEIFGGTGGERFVELIGNGEQALRDLAQRAEDVGAVLDAETIDKAVEIDRRFNELRASVGGFFKEIVVNAADAVLALGDVEEKLDEIYLNGLNAGQFVDPDTAETLREQGAVTDEAATALRDYAAEAQNTASVALRLGVELMDMSGILRAVGQTDAADRISDVGAAMTDAAAKFLDGKTSAEDFTAEMDRLQKQAGTAAGEIQGIDDLGFSGVISRLGSLGTALQTIINLGAAARKAVSNAADPGPLPVDPRLAAAAVEAERNRARNQFLSEEQRVNGLSRERLDLEREIAAVCADAAKAGVRLTEAEAERLAAERIAADEARSAAGKGKTPSGGGTRKVDEVAALLAQGEREIAQLEMQIGLIGKSAEETAFLTAQYELLQQAKEKGLDLDRVNIETGKTLRQEIDEQAAAVARLTVQYDQAKQQADFFRGVTEDLQDGLIDAIVAGEDFRGVMASVAQEIAKAALQAALFGRGPLAGLFGGVSSGGLLGLFGFASGGYTGTGGKYEPAGVVHKGEYVFSADAVRRIGVANLEAMHRQLKGYAGGGSVAAPAVNVAPAAPNVQVAIIDDESRFGEYLAQDPRAERAILQVVRRNGIGRAQ